MAKRVVIEEYHLTVLISRRLSKREADAIHRTLTGPMFERRVLRAVKRVFRKESSLAQGQGAFDPLISWARRMHWPHCAALQP